ncbi:hypothetical protein Tco_0894471 [Tanacetum coccineum]|uniref:Phospholipase-like protein n=1 Tax=Tanacetum coccineum TaxID=301880 RepID=A0ABQ5CI50_9ASTR
MLGRQMLLVGGENENVPLYYHMYDNFQIQFGREEFCLVTGLKFGVEYSDDYDDKDKPIPFRRRVFSSRLDGILQLVLLGLEDKRPVPNWILRLANDRDGWDDYPWGSYVWPTLYYSLKDANVKRWLPLYATQSTNEDKKKTYSLLGFTWAFKTWILEVFRLGPNEFYTRHMRYPRIVAWTSNKKFYRPMLRKFLHGRVPAERLIPDEVEAGSGWWLSREQRSGMDQMMKQGQNIVEAMKKYMEELNVDTRSNREPIIADQHYGLSDLSGFQSIQGGPSPFQTPTNNPIFNTATPTNWQTSMPSQSDSSNWHSQMPVYTPNPNWQPPNPSHPGDDGLCDPVILKLFTIPLL